MASFFPLFLHVTVPILIVCALGVALQSFKSPDSRGLAEISLLILSPCLIFVTLATEAPPGSVYVHILLFTVLHTALCWAGSTVAGRLFRLGPASQRAMDLTSLFGNSNNYGLPLLLLAFGTQGFTLGATYVAGQVILVNTLGLYLASRSSFRPKQAWGQIVKMPLLYAGIAGIAWSVLAVPLPSSVESGLKLVGNAYPAVVLLILGIQLRKTNWRNGGRKEIWLAVALRMLFVPAAAFAVIRLLGLHGVGAAVLFVQSSMPAAVNAVVLMEKYDGDKELVSAVVALTTVASFVWLPVLIHLTERGF